MIDRETVEALIATAIGVAIFVLGLGALGLVVIGLAWISAHVLG